MTVEELNKVFDELKEQGLSDEDLKNAVGKLFVDEDLTKDQFVAFIHQLGFDVTDKFNNLSEDEARKSLFDGDEDSDEEEVDSDYDELDQDEKDLFEESGEEEAESDEKEKAMKLMGLSKDEKED